MILDTRVLPSISIDGDRFVTSTFGCLGRSFGLLCFTVVSKALGRQVGLGMAFWSSLGCQVGFGMAVSKALGREVGPGMAVWGALGRQVGPGTAVWGALGRQVGPEKVFWEP